MSSCSSAVVSLGLGFAVVLSACAPRAHENPHVQAVVETLTASRHEPTNRSANAAANEAFRLLLQDQGPTSDEALAILAAYYLGDSGEPECEILARGQRMLPLLSAADSKPNDLPLRRPGPQSRTELAELIRQGKRCDE